MCSTNIRPRSYGRTSSKPFVRARRRPSASRSERDGERVGDARLVHGSVAHRGLLMRLLTPKRLQENEAFMERLANQRIDGFVANGQCDFVAEYAQPFSMLVIADLLGIPEADHAALRARFVEAGAPGAPGKDIPSNPLWFLEDFFIPYIEDRRREPQDDVLTKLALGTFSDGSMPELIETVRVATFLFAGGQGTVARFLGNTV